MATHLREFCDDFDARQGSVKVIVQQYAYGVSELIGELLRSWGLFLGLSLASVLQMLETLILKVLDRATNGGRRPAS